MSRLEMLEPLSISSLFIRLSFFPNVCTIPSRNSETHMVRGRKASQKAKRESSLFPRKHFASKCSAGKARQFSFVLRAIVFSCILIVWKWVPKSQTRWPETSTGFTRTTTHQIHGTTHSTETTSSMISWVQMCSTSTKLESRMEASPSSSSSLCSFWFS